MAYMRAEFTGAGDIDVMVSPSGPWLLDEVRIHLKAASSAVNLTTQIKAAKGSQWDVVLDTIAMSALTDASYLPARPRYGLAGDKINIAWVNANTVEYGLIVIWRSA